MEETWLQALAKMIHGIYALTTSYRDEINAMIVSWVSQISYEPPLVMVAIHTRRYSHRLVEKDGSFALHILDRNQADLVSCFKGPAGLLKGFPFLTQKTFSAI